MGERRFHAVAFTFVVVLAGCGGSSSGGTGSDSPTSTTEPVAVAVERQASDFVDAYLKSAFGQRPKLNGTMTKDQFTQCVKTTIVGTARSVFASRQLPPEGDAQRATAEGNAAREALTAAQTSIEPVIASCSHQ